MNQQWKALSAEARKDIAICRETLRLGSQSFYAASLILPRDVREPASALYAYCRLADDAIDDGGDSSQAVRDLHARLDGIYAGSPQDNAIDRAMAAVVRQYAIPQTLPAALIEGFEWDVAGRRYQSLSELYDYAARVAGTVGAMMAMLMGVRAPDVLARACDLGVAMQLTNIARDVGEDARAGRLYLPLDELRRHGVDPHRFLEQPEFSPAIGRVVATLLEAADELYLRSTFGIAQLPVRARPGIYAAARIYAEIGRVIESRDLDSVSTRAVVPRSRKIRLLAHSLLSTVRPRVRDYAPPLRQVKFLVDAVASS